MFCVRFIRSVEETVIKTLKEVGVDAERSEINSGVWVNNNKISAVGINASRWITMHGTSLNINCDLNYFADIVPCGIDPSVGGVCRLSDMINRDITSREIHMIWQKSFSSVFDCILEPSPVEEISDFLLQSRLYSEKSLEPI